MQPRFLILLEASRDAASGPLPLDPAVIEGCRAVLDDLEPWLGYGATSDAHRALELPRDASRVARLRAARHLRHAAMSSLTYPV